MVSAWASPGKFCKLRNAKWTPSFMHVLTSASCQAGGADMSHAQMRYQQYRVLTIGAKCAAVQTHPEDVYVLSWPLTLKLLMCESLKYVIRMTARAVPTCKEQPSHVAAYLPLLRHLNVIALCGT